GAQRLQSAWRAGRSRRNRTDRADDGRRRARRHLRTRPDRCRAASLPQSSGQEKAAPPAARGRALRRLQRPPLAERDLSQGPRLHPRPELIQIRRPGKSRDPPLQQLGFGSVGPGFRRDAIFGAICARHALRPARDKDLRRNAMPLRSKVIITCAVTGSIHTPTMSPYLPLTPDEVARDAIAAAEAGAAILHLHARDPKDGRPTPDPEVFMQFLPRIKQATNAVV